MQSNNFEHCIMSAKICCEISETEKDYSAFHTDNNLSLFPKEKGKKYILSMNSLFPFKVHIAKMHISCSFSDTNICLFWKNLICKLPIPKWCKNVTLHKILIWWCWYENCIKSEKFLLLVRCILFEDITKMMQ